MKVPTLDEHGEHDDLFDQIGITGDEPEKQQVPENFLRDEMVSEVDI